MRRLIGCLPALLLLAACTRAGSEPTVAESSLEPARRMDRLEELVAQGAYSEAADLLDRYLGEGLAHPRAFLLKGRLLERGEDEVAGATAAMPWYQRAIDASPRWVEPRLALAEAQITAGRLDSAAISVDGIQRLLPEHPAGPYGQGVIARIRGDLATAETRFADALRRDPDFVPALRQSVLLARQRGDRVTQRRHLERLIGLVGNEADLLIALGRLDEADNRLADAWRNYETAWRMQPDPETARLLADLARQRDDPAAAATWLERSQGGAPPLPRAPDPGP
ncbi:MAG: tetratricopeptide repeat protein [Planctomycetota bacterium]